MEGQKSRLKITNHSTNEEDVGKRLMNQQIIKKVFFTDSSKTQHTVSLNKVGWTEAKCQKKMT